jgi:hypothetical protein
MATELASPLTHSLALRWRAKTPNSTAWEQIREK